MLVHERDELIPTRESLLERLRQWNDHEGWQEFFDTYWKLIYRTAKHAGLSPEQSEEVVQETVIAVSKALPTFEYRSENGSFKLWLLNLTKWRITDLRRKAQREDQDVTHLCPEQLHALPNPEPDHLDLLWDMEWERNLMAAALGRVKRKVDSKHYQIFYLSVVKEWPGSKVARVMDVSLAQVYTVKHRVSGVLKTTLKQIRKRADL